MYRAANFLMLLFLGTASCVKNDPSTEMYVCAPPGAASAVIGRVASIVKQRGFEPAQGRAVDEFGHTNFVLEADNWEVRIWVQNAPMDPPREVADIENYSAGLNVDPNRYFISVQARIPSARGEASEIFGVIREKLKSSGLREC